ncbi:hypothetical protein [Nonomuraea sp. NPDC049750]|uniref:hypothetical protein n=1 Tax=Nonomuraea sp. NPDC049750 TaxID=3154738 RepID=UPI0033DE8CE6
MTSNSPPITSGIQFVPDELGWAWAAHLQRHTCGQWLVLWEPGSQHFTAFYLGETAEGGAYRKAGTPQGLWQRILAFDPIRPHLDFEGNEADDSSAWQLWVVLPGTRVPSGPVPMTIPATAVTPSSVQPRPDHCADRTSMVRDRRIPR